MKWAKQGEDQWHELKDVISLLNLMDTMGGATKITAREKESQ